MDDETNRKKLIEYLPPFMQRFGEIKEITGAEQPELDKLDGNIQRILDNGFIRDCDEFGIQKYENILGIIPDAGDCLELRKSRVLIAWNYSIPYTYKTLIRKLNALCGVNNYNLSGNLENYELIVSTKLEIPGQTREMEILLMKILPENMAVTIINKLSREISGKISLATAMISKKAVTISTDMEKGVVLDGCIISGTTITEHIQRIINN